MHIAATGSAAGTGVSEAKLKASAGQVEPAAGAIAPSLAQAAAVNTFGGAASAKALQQLPIDVANVPAIAAADVLKLAQILQPANLPERAVRVDRLIRDTIGAIHEGRIGFAVGRLIEAAAADPARVDEIRSMPEFEPIRANVEHVMAHLTNIAKMDAETKLASAEQLFEDAGYPKLPNWETAAADLLRIGHRLIEAGGYVNYVRTAELAATLKSAYWAAIDPRWVGNTAGNLKKEEQALKRKGARPTTFALIGNTWDALREELPHGMRAAWARAPLLVLLGAWLALGLGGGLLSKLAKIASPELWIAAASTFGSKIWGLGFLALAGLGFWAGIRKRRT